jgi:hypothetical protein
MQDCGKTAYYQMSRSLKIKNNSSSSTDTRQYDLKQNKFDPSKSSPPNDFMEKLILRIAVYESFSKKGAILASE